MKGTVVGGLEAMIPIAILDPEGEPWMFDAVIDTGAICQLTLPSEMIQELGLVSIGRESATLADQRTTECRMYEVNILWNGEVRLAEVLELEGDPLIGMRLLAGQRVTIDVVDGGQVEVSPLNHELRAPR